MPDETEDLTCPFKDGDVRRAWLDVLEYLEDDELPAVTYRDWTQVAKDSAFDVLLEEQTFEYLGEYLAWVSRLQDELTYLNRRRRARARD